MRKTFAIVFFLLVCLTHTAGLGYAAFGGVSQPETGSDSALTCYCHTKPQGGVSNSVGQRPTSRVSKNTSPVRAWAVKACALTGLEFLFDPIRRALPYAVASAPLGLKKQNPVNPANPVNPVKKREAMLCSARRDAVALPFSQISAPLRLCERKSPFSTHS